MDTQTILEKLDIFGDRITFTINKNKVFKTTIGGIFSIFAVILIMIMSIFFGKDFYFRDTPYVLEQVVNNQVHEWKEFDPNRFIIAWRIEDRDFNVMNFTNILYFNATLKSYVRNHTNRKYYLNKLIQLQSKSCNDSAFEKLKINSLNRSEWNCLNFFDNKKFKIGGKFEESDIVNYLNIKLSNCPGQDKNCSSLKKITDMSNSFLYFTTLFPKVNFDYSEEDPFKNFFHSTYTALDPHQNKVFNCFINSGNFTDDKGIVFKNYRLTNFFSYDKCYLDSSIFELDDYSKDKRSNLINIYMYRSMNVLINLRRHMKLQELFAELGGFIALIKIIIIFIYSFINQFEKNKKFIDLILEEKISNLINESNKNKNLLKNHNDQIFQNLKSFKKMHENQIKSFKLDKNIKIKDQIDKSNLQKSDNELKKINESIKIESNDNTIIKSNRTLVNNEDNNNNNISNDNNNNFIVEIKGKKKNFIQKKDQNLVNQFDKFDNTKLNVSKLSLPALSKDNQEYDDYRNREENRDILYLENEIKHSKDFISDTSSFEFLNEIIKYGYITEIKKEFSKGFKYFEYLFNNLFQKKHKKAYDLNYIYLRFESAIARPLDIYEYSKVFYIFSEIKK